MKSLFDHLLARLLLAQIVVFAIAFAAMVLTVGQQRSAAAAKLVAPLWADSLQLTTKLQPDRVFLLNNAPRQAQQPPAGAERVRALRYRVLQRELIAAGVPAGEVRVERTPRGEVVWLEVREADAPGVWFGFVGGILGVDEPSQQPLFLLVVAISIFSVSALLTWMIVRPLIKLRQTIDGYRLHGILPEVTTTIARQGTREVRSLSLSFFEMARAQNQLASDRTLMLASVSHDLRSPLARIRLAADLLPDTDAEVANAKTAIKKDVDVADRQLTMFLEFSTPIIPDQLQSLDTSQAWAKATSFSPLISQSVRYEISPEARTVFAYEPLLVRILSMGLENAHKHGAAPIYARSIARDGKWLFEVEDCGKVGASMPASERERIMRPFERGETARTTPGAGLGLTLAAQMAARIGGSVALDQGQHGFIFRLTLPIVSSPS
jgi:two-component system osmolarity sensor histidine kinase EnvZ